MRLPGSSLRAHWELRFTMWTRKFDLEAFRKALLLGHLALRIRRLSGEDAGPADQNVQAKQPDLTNSEVWSITHLFQPNRTIHYWKPKQTAGSSNNLTPLQMINSDCAQWRRDLRKPAVWNAERTFRSVQFDVSEIRQNQIWTAVNRKFPKAPCRLRNRSICTKNNSTKRRAPGLAAFRLRLCAFFEFRKVCNCELQVLKLELWNREKSSAKVCPRNNSISSDSEVSDLRSTRRILENKSLRNLSRRTLLKWPQTVRTKFDKLVNGS